MRNGTVGWTPTFIAIGGAVVDDARMPFVVAA
jgi:hypothetical protein